ncbi:MAG: TrmH family RNA methyltransferase [Alphaproteobacteria bacterium]
MGSEGKGMRRLVEEACDITVRLPISAKVESLNVSTAAAIALMKSAKINGKRREKQTAEIHHIFNFFLIISIGRNTGEKQ